MVAMPGPRRDPYDVLGVGPGAADSEIRTAYRRLVQLHHPDHNNGSIEATRRFEEVQEAYAAVLALRRGRSGSASAGAQGSARQAPPPGTQSAPAADPHVETRIADLERQVREAHAARERARRAAREAAAASTEERPSDEELGYIKTEDSFSKVLADALDELAGRLKGQD
jgi:DnaJ-class molecular chaperone